MSLNTEQQELADLLNSDPALRPIAHWVEGQMLKGRTADSVLEQISRCVSIVEKDRIGTPERPDDIPADSEIVYDVTLEDGKYRFVYLAGDEPPRAYRHGEPWQAASNSMLGNKSMFCLVARVAELETWITRPPVNLTTVLKVESRETSDEIASMAARILSAGNPLDNEQVISALVEEIAKANSLPEVRAAFDTMFKPYFDNMLSLAGSALSQAE